MKTKADIKNVVFDLGGVVIDLARENAVAELQKIGLADAGELLGLYKQEEPFLGLETGHCTAAELFDLLRERCRPGTSDREIASAFEAFLVDIPVERLRALRALRDAGYKVYALSNTNPVMFHSWIADKFRQEGLQTRDYFDGIVTSFEEGTCKPDPELFRTVLRRYHLNGDETLMIDDSAANCEGARKAGMQAIRIDNSSEDASMLAVVNNLISSKK